MTDSDADRDRAPNTWRTYERIVRVNINPVLGKKELNKLSPLDIEFAIEAWRGMNNANLSSIRNRSRAENITLA